MSFFIQAEQIKIYPKIALIGYNIYTDRKQLSDHLASKKLTYIPDSGSMQGTLLLILARIAGVENQDVFFSINRTDKDLEGLSIKKDDLNKLNNILKKLDIEIKVKNS